MAKELIQFINGPSNQRVNDEMSRRRIESMNQSPRFHPSNLLFAAT
jgi:hypothetical protein